MASAALIQFNFADSQNEPNGYDTSVHGSYSITGQVTFDTSATGTLYTQDRYYFGAAGLYSFDAIIKDGSGATVATLGADMSVPNNINVAQGYCCGAGVGGVGPDFLKLSLGNSGGKSALTGASGNFSLVFATNDFGYGKSADFVSNLLYADSEHLLDGIMLSNPIERDNFDSIHPIFGWTGITVTGLPYGGGNDFWMLETISVADVTPTSGGGGGSGTGAVPLPAGGALLIGGLGALGIVRRRRAC